MTMVRFRLTVVTEYSLTQQSDLTRVVLDFILAQEKRAGGRGRAGTAVLCQITKLNSEHHQQEEVKEDNSAALIYVPPQ